jgi:hypothetical protein
VWFSTRAFEGGSGNSLAYLDQVAGLMGGGHILELGSERLAHVGLLSFTVWRMRWHG